VLCIGYSDNHQYHNAKELQNAGASIMIEEKDLTPDNLGAAIKKIISDKVLKDMTGKAKQTGKPDASKIVVDNIYEMVNEKGNVSSIYSNTDINAVIAFCAKSQVLDSAKEIGLRDYFKLVEVFHKKIVAAISISSKTEIPKNNTVEEPKEV